MKTGAAERRRHGPYRVAAASTAALGVHERLLARLRSRRGGRAGVGPRSVALDGDVDIGADLRVVARCWLVVALAAVIAAAGLWAVTFR